MTNNRKKANSSLIKIGIICNYKKNSLSRINRINRIKSIIDNYFSNVSLEEIVIDYTDIDKNRESLEEMDGYILSGSSIDVSDFSSNLDLAKRFNPERVLIKDTNKPILAICFGLHLVAETYGIPVLKNDESSETRAKIHITINQEQDELIKNNEIEVEVNHHDYVSADDEKVNKNFQIIATSKDGDFRYIQYMRHLRKPIFCVQFHPETAEDDDHDVKTIGEEIIANFVSLVVSKKNESKTT